MWQQNNSFSVEKLLHPFGNMSADVDVKSKISHEQEIRVTNPTADM